MLAIFECAPSFSKVEVVDRCLAEVILVFGFRLRFLHIVALGSAVIRAHSSLWLRESQKN